MSKQNPRDKYSFQVFTVEERQQIEAAAIRMGYDDSPMRPHRKHRKAPSLPQNSLTQGKGKE